MRNKTSVVKSLKFASLNHEIIKTKILLSVDQTDVNRII